MICSGMSSLASSSSRLEARRVLCGRPRCSRPAPRLLHAVPAQPGDPSVGAGAASSPASVRSGAPETNGVPTASSSSFPLNSPASAASSSDGPGTFPVEHSARASFRNVLRRSYLGEMLFVVIGSAICGALCYWTVGTPLRRFNPYSFYVFLPEATGVQLGTPLRMKGVPMGSVLSATPMLDRVKVEVEVNEAKTIIPRNAKFELTQSGLIPAAAIDITTPEGVSAEALAAQVAAQVAAQAQAERSGAAASSSTAERGAGSEAAGISREAAGPASAAPGSATGRGKRQAKAVRLASPKDVNACQLQGVLVCQGDQLDGLQGGSMDELMAHMLKSLRQGEDAAQGVGIVPGRGPLQGPGT